MSREWTLFGIDGEQTEIVPFLRLEDGQHGRQRDGVHVIAETHRGDAVERNLDVVRGEVAQRGRQQPHQAVEDDFQHRQALIGHHRGVDDGANAGMVVEIDFTRGEAEQIVDFLLRQHALAGVLAAEVAAAVLDHGGPLQRHGAGEFVGRRRLFGFSGVFGGHGRFPLRGNGVLVHLVVASHGLEVPPLYWITISLNSTALTCCGATAVLTRRVNSSLRRNSPAEPLRSPARSSRM